MLVATENGKEAGINYWDGTGSMYFRHRTYLVVQEFRREGDHKPPRRHMRLFSGAREQVVHALLQHWWSTKGMEFISGRDLVAMAETSPFTVSTTMQELEREEWVESVGKGPEIRRRVADPAALLDAWAKDWTGRHEVASSWHLYAPKGPVVSLLSKLVDRDGWALTGAAAANAVVPHLTSVDRAQVIVPKGKGEKWASDLGLKTAEKGFNVLFIERQGAALMFPGWCS